MQKSGKEKVVGVSCRLREVQRGFADESESRQKEHLSEELDKMLEDVPYAERRAFLQELLKRFPVWQANPCSSANEPVGTEEVPSVPDDPVRLAETLVQRLGSADADQKQAVLSILKAVVPETSNAAVEQIDSIRSSLHLPADATVHAERIVALANHLIGLLTKFQQLTATVWAKVAAKSILRPPRHIEQTVGRFLTDDGNNGTELAKELRQLLEFTTAIMTAANRVSEGVAERYSHKLSPEAIRTLVDLEQSQMRLRDALLSNKDVRCWRKYCELAETLKAEHIEKEIEATMSDYAEAFVKGLERLG